LPGLHPEEKATLLPLGVLSLFFLTAALFIAHTFTIPWMNHALLAFNQSLGSNFWGVESYLDYVLGLYLAHAALFEISLLLLFFVYKGWISTHHFTNGRKGAYLTAFILGAFLTPPDVFSQLCVAVPLIILFEIAAFWASLKRTV
jgi:sec-independent protein translocase protein TatC